MTYPSDQPDRSSASPNQSGPGNPIGWTIASAQSVGRQREHNEDALFTLGSQLAFEDTRTFFGFFAVADGMGGHEDGEIASGLAVHTLAEKVIGSIYSDFLSGQAKLPALSPQEILLDGTQEANRVIKRQVPGGGTTLTALLIYQNQFHLIHVGDSRAYLFAPDGTAQVLTRDHSFVRQLVDLGQLSTEEAAIHPQRNILSMALGQWEPLEPDYLSEKLPESGYLLLCSDGLWGVVPEKEISQIIQSSNDLQDACQELILAANQAGGPDNITAILIRIPTKI